MSRKIGKCVGFLIVGALMFRPVVTAAQDITFDVSVDRKTVALGESLVLSMTVRGNQSAGPFELPSLDGFDSRYLGPSTHVSIVNGRYSSSIAYNYRLIPLKAGTFTVPPITVTINGRTYISDPVDISVISQPINGQQRAIAPSGRSLEDNVFLMMKIDRREVYLNERVPLTIKLYVNQLSVRDVQFPELEADGFRLEEFARPRQYSEVIGGVQYDVVEFAAAFFPTRTGELAVGPAELSLNVLIKEAPSSRSPFGEFGSFFDEEFFDSFFESYRRYPLRVSSADVRLAVKPLPEENRPEGFTGAVGQFDFRADVMPEEVSVGDPLTVRMTITGEGNLQTVRFPAYADTGDFKAYDPEIKEQEKDKTLEQVLIPKHDEVDRVPAAAFSFFDPEEEQYRMIRRGPFPIKVKPAEKQDQFKVVGLPPAAAGTGALGQGLIYQEELGEDILFLKEDPGVFRKRGRFVFQSLRFVITVILSLAGFLGYAGYYYRRERLRSDVSFARRLKAPRRAKEGIRKAEALMKADQPKEFYDCVFKTLQEYLGDTFHLSSGGITWDMVRDIVRKRAVDTEVDGRLKAIFEDCDAIRFAPLHPDRAKMKMTLADLRTVIDYLEKRV